ncbi:MAG TPA: hypothetical protein VMF57_02170 [Solirubrobacteraceae bacterium]|nr:hypothetical protein [Solirubrobacteraceae bacterium]
MMRLQILLYAPGAVMLVVGLVACGSTGVTGSGTTDDSNSGSQLALAECMRSHGVSNFPDPTEGSNGGGAGFRISAVPGSSTLTVDGTTFGGPAFESAVKKCKLFGGGTAPPPVTASQKRAAVAFAECLRKHGVPNFPDPTFPASGGIAQNAGTSINRNSPAFQKAIAVCNRSSS